MRPTIVLLHGFTQTGASWQPTIAALGERYLALAPDIRGHGEAAARRPVTLEAVIGDIAALAPARFTLAGYSMGGRLALHCALAWPQRVERLVLLGASPGLPEEPARQARRASDERLAQQIEADGVEQFAHGWAGLPLFAGQSEAVRRAAHEDRLRNDAAGLAEALRGLGTGALPSLWGRLGELTMPVVVAAGERDEKYRAIAAEMAGALPRGELAVIPGVGHAAQLEAPAAFAALL